jgi:CubicO group peptidase (beta-lactamase class C family)
MRWLMGALLMMGFNGLILPSDTVAGKTSLKGEMKLPDGHVSINLEVKNQGPGSGPWSFGLPEDHGLDPSKVKAAARKIGEIDGRQGIVFVRNGVIVYEQYWASDYHLAEPTFMNPSFSSGKSWGSSMVGVAVTEGLLKVEDLASPYHSPEASGLHPEVTIKHLLTMSSGGTLVRKPSTRLPRKLGDDRPRGKGLNYVRADKPEKPSCPEGYGKTLVPGTLFYYDGVPADHLANIVAKASGMSSHAYITEHLLKPLGVEAFAYQPEGIDDQGNIRIGGSIELSVRDMARLGQLWLNKGFWGGRRLIDAQFIEDATSPSKLNPGYGYLWWLNHAGRVAKAPKSMFFAAGAFGQYAFVLPEQNMVIATMGFNLKSGPLQDPNAMWDILSYVLP